MKNTMFITMLVICATIAGCQTLPGQLVTVASVDDYLARLDHLHTLDAEGLSATYRKAVAEHQSDPSPEKQLYLALVLAQPDYPESDAQAAQEHLSAIQEHEAVSPTVKQLARVKSTELERRLENEQAIAAEQQKITKLRAELAEVESNLHSSVESEQALRRQLEEIQTRTRELTDANQELQDSLNEANAKLRELTEIEKGLNGG